MKGALYKQSRVKLIVSLSVIFLIALGILFHQSTKAEPRATTQIRIQKPTPTIAAIPQSLAATFYSKWKQTYVLQDKTNHMFRVYRPEDYNDTVSEGIAAGMLAAVSQGDKQTFDGLWNYAKQHSNNHGLMAWHIRTNGQILDTMSATDADEDMAYALIVADTKWGGYKSDALQLLSNIMSSDIEQDTYILKPGDTWGGSDVLSPSYYSPVYYDIFANYSGDASWKKVKDANAIVLGSIIKNTVAGKTGLIPDWTTASGTEVTIYTDKPYIFGYKSINSAWRLYLAAIWNHDAQSIQELQTLSEFFKTTGTDGIVDGYSIDGVDMGSRHYQAFVDAAIIASQYNHDISYKNQMVTLLSTIPLQNSFYADTYRLITLLVLSNQFPQIKIK